MSHDLKSYFSSRPPSAEDLLTSLHAVVDSGLLHSHLESIVKKGESAPSAITAYHHPNGFLKIRLVGVTGEWALRIHLWNAGPTAAPDIHNHRWNFASRIVAGTLVERKFHLTELGDGDWRLLDCRKDTNGTYHYHDRGRCAIRQSAERSYCAGESYLLKYSVLHEATPSGSNPLVTVVLQGADIKEATSVVSAADIDPPSETSTNRVTGHELEDALWRVMDHLPT